MRFTNNEPDQIEIRRAQNTLIVVGTGIILFSVWSTVKLFGTFFMTRKETVTIIRGTYDIPANVSDRIVFVTMFVMMVIFTVLVLAVRLYIGRSAIAEGRGKRKSALYLLLTGLFIAGSISSIVTDFRVVFLSAEAAEQLGALTPDQSLTSLIIEATSLIMMTEMVISAIKVRKLKGRENHLKD